MGMSQCIEHGLPPSAMLRFTSLRSILLTAQASLAIVEECNPASRHCGLLPLLYPGLSLDKGSQLGLETEMNFINLSPPRGLTDSMRDCTARVILIDLI